MVTTGTAAVPRRRARRVGGGLLLVSALSTLAVLGAGGVHAREQERLRLTEGETLVVEYPPIQGTNAEPTAEAEAGSTAPLTPEECRQQPLSCDVVPVTLHPPEDRGSEFLARYTLHWEAEQPSDFVALRTSDLNMYLWHDPPREQPATYKDDDVSSNDNPGAEFRRPERINHFTTEFGSYLLLINNAAGVNDGHTLTVEYITGELPTPFESLDPAAPPPSAARRDARASTAPPGTRAAVRTGSAAARSAGAVDDGLDVAQLGDDRYAGIRGAGDAALQAPPSTVPLGAARAVDAPDGHSWPVVLLTFLVLPVTGITAGAWLLRRRAHLVRGSERGASP